MVHLPWQTEMSVFRRRFKVWKQEKKQQVVRFPHKKRPVPLSPTVLRFRHPKTFTPQIHMPPRVRKVGRHRLTVTMPLSPSATRKRPSVKRALGRLKVLMIPDVFGWAHDMNARGIQKYSRHKITIRPIAGGRLTPQIINAHDVIFLFSNWCWNHLPGKHAQLQDAIRRKPLIIYCCGSFLRKPSTSSLYAVCTERAARRAKSLGIRNVVIAREGVDTAIFKPTTKKTSPKLRVGWAGNSGAPINRCYLLKKLDYPVKMMSQHGAKYFMPNRSRAPMVKFYNNLDVYVMLMKQGKAHGVNLTVLEAMSCGLPVIATNVCSIRKVVPPSCLVPANPDSRIIKTVNQKLKMFDERKDVLRKVGQRNRRFIVKYRSWKVRVKEWDRLFEKVARQ